MADGTILPDATFSVAQDDPGQIARIAELARLAALDPMTYDQQRDIAAKALECRMPTLDKEIAALRTAADAGAGRGVELPSAEPWPEPIRGADGSVRNLGRYAASWIAGWPKRPSSTAALT